MLNRPLNAVIVRLALVASALALLMVVAPVAFAATAVSYPENGTDSVATFSATDPDGDPIVWSLGGADAEKFTITDGVLAFKSSPNYEKPDSKSTGTLADRNVYKVDVKASGGTEEVTVTVTDVDEAGSVSFTQYQPQVGRPLSAELSDVDAPTSDVKWQWSRGASADGEFTDIDKATMAARAPVADDAGMYLRATATYTDKFGSGKTVSGVSDNAVEARTLANAAPSFEDQENDDGNVVRKVAENTAVGASIGAPLTATDADGDVLIYGIKADATNSDTSDDEFFSIDRATGQLKVKVKVNYESTTGPNDADNCNTGNECTVTVTATDPSTVTTEQVVTVNVTDVNEVAAFPVDTDSLASGNQPPPTELEVAEEPSVDSPTKQLTKPDGGDDDTDRDDLGDTDYVATDPDDPPGAATSESTTYSLEGADKAKFDISDEGVLKVCTTALCGADKNHDPNYEKQSSYSITIVATSGTGDRTLSNRLDVTIKVKDAEDSGTVTLSQIGPQVGRPVVATLSDPDGGETISTWQWSHTTNCNATSGWTNIPGATSASYTPKKYTPTGSTQETAIVGQCLRATATYKDDFGTADETAMEETDAVVQASHADNSAPQFPDQDLVTPGDQRDSTSRSVAENTEADKTIGAPVEATDADETKAGRLDKLLYTLSGTDAASFKIDRKTGQLKTKAALDYEALPADAKYYMVTVTATDPSGASASIMVTINVTDEDDGATITGTKSYTYAENGTESVATFTATDPDGDAIVWSLGGRDKGDFTIDGGVLAFKKSPDYETPVSDATGTLASRNVYKVDVKASGGTEEVTVTVTDVDEAGKVTLTQYQPQVGRPLSASVSDQDKPVSGEKWQWSRGASADDPSRTSTRPRRRPAHL